MSGTKGKILFLILNFYLTAHAEEFTFKPSLVTSLNIGASFQSAGQQQTLALTPSVTKTYTSNNLTSTLPTGELFVGIRNSLPANLDAQLGLAFSATGNAMLSGNIWDDGDPAFNNYTYQYTVGHIALGLKGKITGDWDFPIMPWLSASIAIGFNNACNFSNTPTIPQALASPNFANSTTTTFSYAIGAGAQYKFNPHWQFGVGYEFSDWGASQLGAVPGGTAPGLSLSHLFTHSVLLNITYLLEIF